MDAEEEAKGKEQHGGEGGNLIEELLRREGGRVEEVRRDGSG